MAAKVVVVVVVGLVCASALSTPLSGATAKEVRMRPKVSWPQTGLDVCQWLVDASVQRSCLDCFNTAGTWRKTKRCVGKWLPSPIANCSSTASTTKKAFNKCVSKNYNKSVRFNKKADVFYKKSDRVMSSISRYPYLENGPAALFSSFAQDLLFADDDIQRVLSTSEDCSDRYNRSQGRVWQPVPVSGVQSRELDYEYGKVGHDMPFKGVGPLALAALSGMCTTRYLEDQQKLQLLVDAAVNAELPVPAWVFREVVKNINSVQI